MWNIVHILCTMRGFAAPNSTPGAPNPAPGPFGARFELPMSMLAAASPQHRQRELQIQLRKPSGARFGAPDVDVGSRKLEIELPVPLPPSCTHP